MMTAKEERIALRVPSVLRTALERAAEAERRTLSSLVAVILEDWVAKHPIKKRASAHAR